MSINKRSRLQEEYYRCRELYSETRDDKYLYKTYNLEHYFECETRNKYEIIKEFAQNHGFDRIYDIGCAYGYQSEVFLDTNIDYVGVNDDKIDFWNAETYEYNVGNYPFKLTVNKEKDLAVSVLCLTWNCYLYEDTTLHEQCKQLTEDFNNVLLYMSNDKVEFVGRYFGGYEIINGKFVYFYN